MDARGLTLVVEGGTAFTLGPSSAKRTYSLLAKGMSNFNNYAPKNILLTKFEVHHQCIKKRFTRIQNCIQLF